MLGWMDRLLTPVPLHLREMGYVRELWGIRQRWNEFRPHWKQHTDRTRAVILQGMARCRRRRKAVVLGSGWLHDVPAQELCDAFARVVFVDLVHPWSVRWRARRWRNASFLAEDVSGVSLVAWQCVEKRGTPLPPSHPSLFLDDPDLDFVASVNLLSQLPCMPAWYLRKHRHPESQIEPWCRQVVEAHLAYLRRLPGTVCFVGDTEAETRTQSGETLSRRSTLHGAAFPWEGERWEWRIIPRKDKHPHAAEVLHVVGVPDLKELWAGTA
ncbi:MAG: hypothetical protein K2W96_12465 [Gemmataceae bacterium]|nr:hypothetical protein [Gemmataceae bacterium]